MSDFRVDVRVRNNLLLSAIENSLCRTVAGVTAHGGPSLSIVYAYLNLRRSPIAPDGNWTESVLRICDAIGVLPDEVFTEAHYDALKTNRAQFVADMGDIQRLASIKDPSELLEEKDLQDSIAGALSELGDREQQVLRMRNFDDMSLGEIAERFDLSVERIRQIEAKALRKLRHPSRRHLFEVAA